MIVGKVSAQGGKDRPSDTLLIATEASAQARGLVRELCEGEELLRHNFKPAQDGPGALLWGMVADGVPEAAAWYAAEARTDVLCERALRLRGGLSGGPERLAMREKARILAHLSEAAHEPPRSPDDLLSLWDEATRLEPAVRLRVLEPRWRTGDDDVPFTTTPLSRFMGAEALPLPPGKKTADPDDIPMLVDWLLAFLAAGGPGPVLTAAHVPHLIGRIHPFVDGNGHTGRLLMCDLLSRAGFGAPTLVAYVAVHCRRAEQWAALMDSACLGQAGADELVSFQLRMLAEAQAAAKRTLNA